MGLWAFRSGLEMPLAHVTGVEVDPEQARLPWSTLPVRTGTVWLQGRAGGVRQNGSWASWDVSDPQRALIIRLADERYDQPVVEVDDPADGAARILQAIGDRSCTKRCRDPGGCLAGGESAKA